MADDFHGREPGRDEPARTIGPLAPEPTAPALGAGERARLARRRDELWEALEERAGRLADRDAAAWYEILIYERPRGRSRTGGSRTGGSRTDGPRTRGARTRGLSPTALAGFYRVKRFIPRSVQLALRRGLIARKGLPAFPAWPFESAGADLVKIALADALLDRGVEAVRFPWFWPAGARAAVTLTHDVESADGLARASIVAAWEERHGFRSSFNVVADSYPIDMRLVADLAERGHEIGSHGLRHDRSLFASRRSFERRLPALREAAQRFGAVGFRSPATHRVVEWLAELPFSYDCTMPLSDPFEPIPGGCATVWPFFHGDVVELPYTAPQDHTLFNLLGHRDCTLWRRQLERVVACNGLFQPITHPDAEYLGTPLIGDAYRELLEAIAHREALWVALPREVADWWRHRAAGFTPRDSGLARWNGSEIELVPRAGRRSG